MKSEPKPEDRAPGTYFLTAAEFHAQAAAIFETAGHREIAALARRRETQARRKAHERPRRAADVPLPPTQRTANRSSSAIAPPRA